MLDSGEQEEEREAAAPALVVETRLDVEGAQERTEGRPESHWDTAFVLLSERPVDAPAGSVVELTYEAWHGRVDEPSRYGVRGQVTSSDPL